MRIIYSSNDQKQALVLSNFLKSQGIDNQFEVETSSDWENPNYGATVCHIWVIDEDSLENALKWRDEFELNPNDKKFQVSESALNLLDAKLKEAPAKLAQLGLVKEENSRMGFVTLYIMITCIMLFLYAATTTPDVTKVPLNIPSTPIITPPINKSLMIDYPKAYQMTDQLVTRFGLDKVQNPETLPQEAVALINKISQTPYWQGIYDKVVALLQDSSNRLTFTTPMFEKVREGEFWRLITPMFMHGSILHLAFNLILFVILGKQMEKKIGAFKYIVFIILAAAFSNTVQYLMSGADFLGISGVICAMIGFVFVRQSKAAWEGYQFSSISLSSVVVFIMLMFFIQFAAFLIEIFFKVNISPGIANAAHLSGLFIGIVLGQLNFFKIQHN